MEIAISCLLMAALLHVVSKVPVAMAMSRQGKYDNNQPRAQEATLTGFGHRALAAHENTLEAFPPFAAGVIVALVAQADQSQIDALAVTFVIARLLYLICYLSDIAWLRSLVWAVGYLASLTLMALPLLG